MLKRLLHFFLMSGFCLLTAAIVHVPADQPSIQDGIDAAADGDTVLVQPGVYIESVDYHGKAVTVASLFHTTQDTAYIANTVIDAAQQSFHTVEFTSFESGDSKLIGFTVTGGLANGSETEGQRGGGIYASGAAPTIRHCVITGNQAVDCGGGASLTGSFYRDATLDWCRFEDNVAGLSGGGLHLIALQSASQLTECAFIGNSAENGGGLFALGDDLSITESRFVNNVATNDGGALVVMGDGLVKRCVFLGNSASRGGAVAAMRGNSDIFDETILLNCTLSQNSADDLGGALFGKLGSMTYLVNTIAWDNAPQEIAFCDTASVNTLVVAHSDVQGGQEAIVAQGNGSIDWLNGNLDADPLFAANSFELTGDSPCIDAGTAEFVYNGLTYAIIPAGEYAGAAPDLGVWEWTEQSSDIEEVPLPGLQMNAWPNPFNPEVNLCFSLPAAASVQLTAYNIRGQRVAKLVDAEFATGSHTILWNAAEHPSGVYLLRLQAGRYSAAQRVTLLK